ncbi:MAG: hypothetical protein SFT94_02160 [Pseudanabaenaceae cyanobacterium bins.68]|nr:hypothetical protein [Pseudanabaenaceae cyanobacterium bins.68]
MITQITQNSTQFIFFRPDLTLAIPKLNGEPNWSGISEPTLSILQSDYEAADQIPLSPDPIPVTMPRLPDWEGLKLHLLAGELYPIFQRLTLASLDPAANPLSTARGDVTDSILVVKDELALASAIQLLRVVGWVFTAEEIELWNRKTAELGFSGEVGL